MTSTIVNLHRKVEISTVRDIIVSDIVRWRMGPEEEIKNGR